MVTIILPVSRDMYLKRVFAQLELLQCDRTQVNLLCFVDGPLNLFEKARNFTVNSKFNEKLCVYRRRGEGSVGSIKRRRQRIADIHNELKVLIKNAEYIFLIEDDTIVPTNALAKLLHHYLTMPSMGIVSGIQIGRWGFDHIGAWLVDDIYSPNAITSVKLEEGLQQVDATGLYCCLTRAEHYLRFNFEPFMNALGPDVAFGVYLRQQGYLNYVDYSIKCDHITAKEKISFDRDIVQVQLTKTSNNDWSLQKL